MISFKEHSLTNGLRLIVHEDDSTPMCVVNVIYDVGAKDEDPEKTGFAHLFEHLMFGGSENIESFDEPLQMAGGENNAFTTNDVTNYYEQVPAENIETALWLESDRMRNLTFSAQSLEVQRKVVCEEFKEHYINKPYGDVWHKLRALAYTTHPYKWMTIGATLKHVEDATLEDVKAFFKKHYNPSNAIVVIAGNISFEKALALTEKYFNDIPAGEKYQRRLENEPEQTSARTLEVEADVPLDALYKCWHMSSRLDKRYYAADLLSDILSSGASSRLFQKLVKEQQLFSSIDCYHMGSTDAGLMALEGKLIKGVSFEKAESAVVEVLNDLIQNGITEKELQKVKNKTESMMAFEDMSLMSRATSLAMYAMLGSPAMINSELAQYESVTANEIKEEAAKIFRPENCSTLYYKSSGKLAGNENNDKEEDDFDDED